MTLSGLAATLLIATAPAPPAASAVSVSPVPPAEVYRASISTLAAARGQLAAEYGAATRSRKRAEALDRARQLALRAIVDELIPPWFGTPWRMDGISEVPGEGFIACSYLVSTVLRDAGFHVPRYRLAQAASENIVRSLAPAADVARLTVGDQEKVVEHIRAKGPGLYVVGLDYHVGFVVHEGERMDFCHSSFLPPGSVICEPAATAGAFSSTVHVVAPLLTDWMVRRWLAGERFPVWKR